MFTFIHEPRERLVLCRVAGSYVEADSARAPLLSATILLVRHGSHAEVGHVLSGRSEIALSDAGRAEAARLARRLADLPLAAVHSSPRRRARETAEIIAAPHGLPVEIADALDEIDFGAWAGRSFAALAPDPLWRRWNSARGAASAPGGEDMHAATARALGHIEAGREGLHAMVSHCDVIRGVVAHYLGLDVDRLLTFDVDPASVTTLALHDGGARLVALNERPA